MPIRGDLQRPCCSFNLHHNHVDASAGGGAVDCGCGVGGSGRHALVALGKHAKRVHLVDEVRDGTPHAEAQACAVNRDTPS